MEENRTKRADLLSTFLKDILITSHSGSYIMGTVNFNLLLAETERLWRGGHFQPCFCSKRELETPGTSPMAIKDNLD